MLEESLRDIEQGTCVQMPFPHLVVPSFFDRAMGDSVFNWLDTNLVWEFTETCFYTQFELNLLHTELPEAVQFLVSEAMIRSTADTIKKAFNEPILQLVDVAAHKLVNGHRMGVHNDFIGPEETHRMVIQLNKGWDADKGGFLMLFNSDRPADVSTIIKPINNSAIAFEISPKSYHAVSAVHDFTRYTIVYTFKRI